MNKQNVTELNYNTIKVIEKKLGYKFKNKELIKRAFLHSSMANELNLESNERLEFFGDTVLDFIVSEFLINHTKKLEGDLSVIRSSLVSAKSLSAIISEMSISKYLIVNKSVMVVDKISHNIKCDLYESILGAIYFDGGIEEARRFVLTTLKLNDINLESFDGRARDYKTPLQEYLQSKGRVNIEYRTLEQVGPSHNPTFTIALFINGIESARAVANSKKEAEQECAKLVLEKLNRTSF